MMLALMIGLMPSTMALAAEQGSATGSFSVGGVAPTVSALEVYSDAGCTTVASALTPQVVYYVKVTVSDPNTLNNIDNVTLKLYYDAGTTHPDEATITTGNEQRAAIFTWTKAGSVWGVDAGAGTSWAAVGASSVAPSTTATTGDWIFAIKLGKVATETPVGSGNVWELHARATDHEDYTSGYYCASTKLVSWYGEIQLNTPNITFGEVALKSGWDFPGWTSDTNKYTGVSVKFIANGDYASNVKSSATWTGPGGIATLDPTGYCINDNEFALKVYHQDVYGSAYLVDTTGVNCRLGTQTLETGDGITTGTFWLKVAQHFPVGSYSGTITFTIVNN